MDIVKIKLSLSNVFLILGEKPILVDSGVEKDLPLLTKKLKEHGVEPKNIALIIQTHGHADHCGCTQALKKISGAPIALHSADNFMFHNGQNGPLRPTNMFTKLLLPMFQNARYPGFQGDILLDQNPDLSEFGINPKIISVPGHSPGSVALLFEEQKEAIIGDLVLGGYLNGMFAKRKPTMTFYADDIDQLFQSIQTVLQSGAEQFHVGHGGALGRESIEVFVSKYQEHFKINSAASKQAT